jgi:acetoin:2,6-dichlorophenolindophenol oxidoreductase subunit beta
VSRKSYRQALNEALRHEMRRDPTVILVGVDVGAGFTSAADDAPGDADGGGVLGVTGGLIQEFGIGRVVETPISESAVIGMCTGAACTGLRPVADLMFVDFLGVCFDQIFNQAAKLRYMFGGKAKVPLVIRAMVGAGLNAAAQHSQMMHAVFTHIPGLKVVLPSNPYDAKGLLITAIRDDDPVIFLEHKGLYDAQDEVPDEAYTIPFGEANLLTDGDHVTVIAFSKMVGVALEAAKWLEREGIEVELIDPRSTSPLDEASILESVEKTGRLVIVDEGSPRCGVAADIAALIAREALHALKAPIQLITPPHTPVPFSPSLEKAYLPNVEKVIQRVCSLMQAGAPTKLARCSAGS